MTDSTPLVSVVITNYNYADFLAAAIESALAQTHPRVEVVVVDDGSTDGSQEVIARFGGRVRSVLGPHRGLPTSFNRGVAASYGSIVCLLDADDLFAPEKVTRIAAVFAEAPDIDACFHARVLQAADGSQTTVHISPPGVHDYRAELGRGEAPFVASSTSALCFRRTILDKLLPLPEADGMGVQDHALKWGALAFGRVCFLDEPLTIQRLHAANAYTNVRDPLRTAETQLRNAQYFSARFPSLGRFSDRLLVSALSVYIRRLTLPPELRAIARDCLRRRRRPRSLLLLLEAFVRAWTGPLQR